MSRFIKFLVLNIAGLSVAGWMQMNLLNYDSIKTRLASAGLRGASGPSHK